MRIPLPCRFGESALCNGRSLPLMGVEWFEWTKGMEYTYFFRLNDKWHDTDFYTSFQNKQYKFFEIPDSLLKDMLIKEHGYPLKGKGYACGIKYKNSKTYMEFIMSNYYLAHIQVQCDENGMYLPDGEIIFPMSWDEKKKEKAVLKAYKSIKTVQSATERCKQLTMFDFLG